MNSLITFIAFGSVCALRPLRSLNSLVTFIALRSLQSLVALVTFIAFISLKGRIIFQAIFIERDECVFLAVLVGHLFRFETVAEVHPEFIERHAPCRRSRRVHRRTAVRRTCRSASRIEMHRNARHRFELCYVDRIGVPHPCRQIGDLSRHTRFTDGNGCRSRLPNAF